MLNRFGPAFLAGFLFGTFNIGCATYHQKMEGVRESLANGQYTVAIDKLRPLAETEDKDQLMYLMELGSAYQFAGQLEESNRVFLKADRLSEEIDYQSVSKVGSSLLFAEEMVQYKGDTFEKFFINANLAMNFLALGKIDEALVEARRINQKYLKYRSDEKKNFEQNAFGLWLSGAAWEATGSFDDAFIAYKNAYDLDPSNGVLKTDLLRAAKLARREDQYQKYKKQFIGVVEDPRAFDRNYGELILIAQQGWGPKKYPDPSSPRFPLLQSSYSETQAIEVKVLSNESTSDLGKRTSEKNITREVYDVDQAAKLTLGEDRSILVAKRLGGIVAKEVAADQIRQKDELLGFIAAVAMHASDRADLRQWSLLPSSIQVTRIYLPPGKYAVSLMGVNRAGSQTGESKDLGTVEVKARDKRFIFWRVVK